MQGPCLCNHVPKRAPAMPAIRRLSSSDVSQEKLQSVCLMNRERARGVKAMNGFTKLVRTQAACPGSSAQKLSSETYTQTSDASRARLSAGASLVLSRQVVQQVFVIIAAVRLSYPTPGGTLCSEKKTFRRVRSSEPVMLLSKQGGLSPLLAVRIASPIRVSCGCFPLADSAVGVRLVTDAADPVNQFLVGAAAQNNTPGLLCSLPTSGPGSGLRPYYYNGGGHLLGEAENPFGCENYGNTWVITTYLLATYDEVMSPPQSCGTVVGGSIFTCAKIRPVGSGEAQALPTPSSVVRRWLRCPTPTGTRYRT